MLITDYCLSLFSISFAQKHCKTQSFIKVTTTSATTIVKVGGDS